MRRKPRSNVSRLLFCFLFLSLLPCGGVAAGQSSSPEDQPKHTADTTSQASEEKNKPEHGADKKDEAGFGAQLAKESREAAGEEEDQSEEFKKSPSVTFLARITGMSLQHAYWLAVLLNFGVVAAFIIWISRSKLPGVFRNRTASIQKAMEEAGKASQEANQRLAEIEARLSKLDVEIGSMRAAAERETAEEEIRIRAAADEDTRKIIATAEQEIAAAAKSARRDLKAYAANLAVSLAQRQIRIDRATDQALVQNFSGQLGATENGSGKDKG